MSYTSVISLSEAKVYLGVDDTSRDAEITRMIKSSLTYIEKATNHLMYDRDVDYDLFDGCRRIYDYPINTDSDNLTVKSLYSIYQDTDSESITLNVGYADPLDIPSDLLDAAFLKLNILFYGQENNSRALSELELIIDHYRRFII